MCKKNETEEVIENADNITCKVTNKIQVTNAEEDANKKIARR